ncbi:MAG: formate dehydrogenase accessory sulfurtransferase FdhD [Thermodesulfobacteriota bacterium]
MGDLAHKLIVHWDNGSRLDRKQHLLREEPLSIRIQGNPYAVVMRTPGFERQHVAGFCLSEGIVDAPEDIANISFCEGEDTNVVTVTLKSSRRDKISEILDRREFISQTSCGLCGKEIVKDLYQVIRPIADNTPLEIQKAVDCLENISAFQPLRKKTRAAHAAVLYDSNYKPMAAAEDVGRHNALDKVVGKLFLEHKLKDAAFLTLSSRISYELVQKSARARIPVVLAISRPTSLAVELATKLNMTLASPADDSGLLIFCGEERLK